MKLVNLKRDVTEQDGAPAPVSMDQYGYGLRIQLNDEDCEALGLAGPIEAGSKVKIEAEALVCSSTQSLDNDGDGNPDMSVSLQITDMGVEVLGVEPNAEQILYGKD